MVLLGFRVKSTMVPVTLSDMYMLIPKREVPVRARVLTPICALRGWGGATSHFGSPRARTAFAISVRARRDAVREWVRPRARTHG